jgi:hypothetical protein
MFLFRVRRSVEEEKEGGVNGSAIAVAMRRVEIAP